VGIRTLAWSLFDCSYFVAIPQGTSDVYDVKIMGSKLCLVNLTAYKQDIELEPIEPHCKTTLNQIESETFAKLPMPMWQSLDRNR